MVEESESDLEIVQRWNVASLAPQKNLIQLLEPRAPYLETLEKLADWKKLRDARFRFVFYPMHGSAAGFLPKLFRRNGITCDEIRGARDPRFGRVHPEPLDPHIDALRQTAPAGDYDA